MLFSCTVNGEVLTNEDIAHISGSTVSSFRDISNILSDLQSRAIGKDAVLGEEVARQIVLSDRYLSLIHI